MAARIEPLRARARAAPPHVGGLGADRQLFGANDADKAAAYAKSFAISKAT